MSIERPELLKTIATAIERAQGPFEEPDADVMARAVLDALAAALAGVVEAEPDGRNR